MYIREIQLSDSEEYLNVCKEIDAESEFLLFEAGERPTTLQEQKNRIEEMKERNNSTILVVEKEGRLIGYLIAVGGQAKRNKHSVYIVVGIKKAYTGQGIGTRLFETLESWAKERAITRLELGVMSSNIAAFILYKKMGFELEGVKKNMFYVNGKWINEYLMAKFLD